MVVARFNSTLRRQSQAHFAEFQANLSYLVRPCLKHTLVRTPPPPSTTTTSTKWIMRGKKRSEPRGFLEN